MLARVEWRSSIMTDGAVAREEPWVRVGDAPSGI